MQREFTGMKRGYHISVKFRVSIFTCLLFVTTSTLTAQIPEQREITTYTITANINLLGGSLQNVDTDSIGHWGMLAGLQVTLEQGELHFKYKLRDVVPKEQRNGIYDVSAIISINNDVLRIRPDKILGDYGKGITTNHGVNREFIVTNLIEDNINLDGKLSVQLNVSYSYQVVLDFDFDCNAEPTFTTGQRIPYLAGGVIGVGLAAWGGIMEGKAQDKYDQYKSLINDNKTLYDDANRQHKTAQALMIAGGAIIVTDIVLYVIRSKKYKKRKLIYEKYCPKKISFRPVIDLPGVTKPSGSVGLAMHFTF